MIFDFAQLQKIFSISEGESQTQRKYSPAQCTGERKTVITGDPNEKHISTSHVVSQNLTIRMDNRRLTRLTNAFSKKIDNHCLALALHFVYYNFVMIHKTLRVPPALDVPD